MRLFNDQAVLLVGLGESGLACARWVLTQGGRLTVLDTRDQPPGLSALDQGAFTVARCLADTTGPFDRIVVSPGLAPSHPLMVEVAEYAQSNGLQLDSEIDLFADALDVLKTELGYSPKVVSITGTNGKTTTTAMVTRLAQQSGLSACAAGNISPAALEALRTALESNTLPQVWVLELSSFQLHWTKRLHSHASVVLNLSQDHLDWHSNEQEYAEDKRRIYSAQSVCVINRDDPVVSIMSMPTGARVWSFGLGQPQAPQQMGLVRDGGIVWLAYSPALPDEGSRRRKAEPEALEVKLLMPTDALKVVGLHNSANALAALALGLGIGLPVAKMLHGLRTYAGEPHRVEHVMTVCEVDYYDDSKGTNVGATVAALNGLQRNCVLIAGGQGKGQDFSPLAAPVKAHCRAVVVFGQDADSIQSALDAVKPVHRVASMKEAVSLASSLAQAGDCVLLSPACASLDMYANYVARAEHFVSEVKELALDRGQVC